MRPGVLFGALSMLLQPAQRRSRPLSALVASTPAAIRVAGAAVAVTVVVSGRVPDVAPSSPPRCPADGTADIVLVDWPATPGAPHVRAATVVAVAPAAIKNVLLDPRNYRKIVPALIRADVSRTAAGLPTVGWEVEVPLFNLTGTLVIHERPDGAEVELVDGDFSPGRLTFTATPRAGGGSTLVVDAQLDIRNAGWLIRRLVKLSPAGEPAALAAAAYVTVARRRAARRKRRQRQRAPTRARSPAPPPTWAPSPRALADDKLAALRAHGAVALVARTWSQRLAGVAVATTLGVPAPNALGRLRDPQSWHAFPGWTHDQAARRAQRRRRRGRGQPCRSSTSRRRGSPSREPRRAGPRPTASPPGARLGWEVYPLDPRANAGAPTLMALMMYPRLETTGRLARKAIASEPLLEHGLAVAVAFADLTAMKTALEAR